MYCSKCGKEIADNSTFCPECGAPQNSVGGTQVNSNPKGGYNSMCILGLVISGISLLLNFFGIVGIAGTIVSVIGMMNCKKSNEKGKGLAIAGIIIGVFSIFYGVISLLSIA